MHERLSEELGLSRAGGLCPPDCESGLEGGDCERSGREAERGEGGKTAGRFGCASPVQQEKEGRAEEACGAAAEEKEVPNEGTVSSSGRLSKLAMLATLTLLTMLGTMGRDVLRMTDGPAAAVRIWGEAVPPLEWEWEEEDELAE